MKYTASKLMTAVALCFTFSIAQATTGPKKEDGKVLRTQILEHLADPDLTGTNLVTETATLHIQVNAKDEMVVVQVDSDSKFVDHFLKSRLNYKKVLKDVHRGRYVMKITLQDGARI